MTKYAFYKWEIFANKLFREFDNLLYVDVDTEIVGDISWLFETEHPTGIYTCDSKRNWLLNKGKRFKCVTRYCNSGVIFMTPAKLGNDVLNGLF